MVAIQDTILERGPSDVDVDEIPNCTGDEEEVKTRFFSIFVSWHVWEFVLCFPLI